MLMNMIKQNKDQKLQQATLRNQNKSQQVNQDDEEEDEDDSEEEGGKIMIRNRNASEDDIQD